MQMQSPSTRRAWIEITLREYSVGTRTSPSTRRAWIEIALEKNNMQAYYVALHPEGVDRNCDCCVIWLICLVALHPEGVDRNNK